jgi:CheY-like chemotaxis protein
MDSLFAFVKNRATRTKRDIPVTDMMMPRMTGDELARRLRQTGQRGLKVLYLTGFSDRLFKEKVTLWEGEAFLDKPCGVQGLLEAVSLLLVGRLEVPSDVTS